MFYYLAELHNDYILVPADKATHMSFVCRLTTVFQCLINEFVMNSQQGTPTYTRAIQDKMMFFTTTSKSWES